MACKETIKVTCKNVRPLLSTNFCEARRRAIGLYRAWYRFIPYIVKYFDIPKTEQDCRCKIREYFYKNAHITDTRMVDMLVIKGFMDLNEFRHTWIQKGQVMAHWNPTLEPQPRDFLSKFLSGHD